MAVAPWIFPASSSSPQRSLGTLAPIPMNGAGSMVTLAGLAAGLGF
jgi:hypothetical protein